MPKPYMHGQHASFSVFKGVLTDNEVAQLLSTCSQVLSEEIRSGRGREPDPVDGHPSFAVKLADNGMFSEMQTSSPALRPLVETVLVPMVRQQYGCPTAALSSALFRRFVPEERRFIAPHHEHGAFAMVVISLQEPSACTGGLFVQGSGKAFLDRRFVQLERGDLCMFQYDLHHGTDVQDGFRYEFVLHFKDSAEAALDGTCPWYRSLPRSPPLSDLSSETHELRMLVVRCKQRGDIRSGLECCREQSAKRRGCEEGDLREH